MQHVLSEGRKSLLKKYPSFVLTSTDINWYEVHKDLTKFTIKIRHLADLDQQQEQVNRQINGNERTISKNNFPPGKSPPKVNLYQQLYRSKPSRNNSVEYLLRILKKNFLTLITFKKLGTNSIKKKK